MKPGGQPNMQQLMKQAQKMQQQVLAAQQELAQAQLEGSSGGGLVTVTMTGAGEVVAVKIKPEAVDPDDVESLEDLVLAAIKDAGRAVNELATERMGPVTGGVGGLGLPGL
ncbi:MAG: YbaB/EbfC family nucleoid-associated protein [Actinomycetota bacterium]|nr:YbaB/EbfC family nucleoid-associated protein [Actinomycetota bacterium]